MRSLIALWPKFGGNDFTHKSVKNYEIYPNLSSDLAILFVKRDDTNIPRVQPVCVYHPNSIADEEDTGYIIDWKRNEQFKLNNPDELGLTKLSIKFQVKIYYYFIF